jgi:hypothetical protein
MVKPHSLAKPPHTVLDSSCKARIAFISASKASVAIVKRPSRPLKIDLSGVVEGRTHCKFFRLQRCTKHSRTATLEAQDFALRPLPHNPLAAGQQCEQLRHHGAADIAEQGAQGDGQSHRHERVRRVAVDEVLRYGSDEEDVHQVHPEGEAAELRHQARRAALADAGEEEEQTEGGEQHVGCAELPGVLQQPQVDGTAGHPHGPVGPCGEGSSHEEADCPHPKAPGHAPADVEPYVVGHHQVAKVARAVPQGVVVVPPAFAPHLRQRREFVEQGHEGGEGEEGQERELVARGGFFEPGRHDGDDEVERDEGIHEPQVVSIRWEVEGQAQQLRGGLAPRQLAPERRQQAVEHHEDRHGRQHAQEPAAVELSHADTRLHGHQQECRDDDEQGHAGAREATVPQGNPQTVGLVGHEGHVHAQPGQPRHIEVLRGVHHHHHEARHHADVVDEHQAFAALV